jgi:hypothetical protein
VSGSACVSGSAWVFGEAYVSGSARVSDEARVFGSARVFKVFHCVNIINLHFNITVTPQNVSIGCKLYTHKEIKSMSKSKAIAKGLPESEYKLFKTLILPLLTYTNKE